MRSRHVASLTVLVVDDNDAMRDYDARILREAGHNPLTVGSGEAGRSVLQTTPLQAIITDVLMPHGDGAALLKSAAELQPTALRIAMSGGGAIMEPDDCLIYARHAGAQRVLRKPFTIEELLAVMTKPDDHDKTPVLTGREP